MITLIIAVGFAGAVFSAAYWGADFGAGWSVFLGLLGFGAVQIVFGRILKRRVSAVMEEVQRIMTAGQQRIQAKMQRWQFRPPGSIQAAQKEIFADTAEFVREAIQATDGLSRFRLWVPMIERQKATAQFQLYWMIKEFRKVDELLPKVLFLEQTTQAMHLARLFMKEAPNEEIAKLYAKYSRRARYNQGVLLAACYSWILVRRGDADGAFKALTEALRNSDDATLKRNHEELANNRVAHFNNSGLGDRWYALQLEEPKVHTQRARSVYR